MANLLAKLFGWNPDDLDTRRLDETLIAIRGSQQVILRELRRIGGKIVATVEEIESVLDEQFAVLTPAFNAVQVELARLSSLVGSGASEEELAEVLAKANESTNRMQAALKALVEAPETPNNSEPIIPNELPDNTNDVLNAE